jgi:hypothetical protein
VAVVVRLPSPAHALLRRHRPNQPVPGDALLHPVVLAALGILFVNDHVLKAWARGTRWAIVTGKLSDVAGLLFLPVLLVAGAEFIAALRGRFAGPSTRHAVIAGVGVAVTFAAMKTWTPAAEVYRVALGVLQWPAFAAVAAFAGRPLPSVVPVRHVIDPTDLVAVPAVGWAFVQARARARSWARSGPMKAANDGR